MKRMTTMLALAMLGAAALVACGGGGSDTPASTPVVDGPPPAPSPPAPAFDPASAAQLNIDGTTTTPNADQPQIAIGATGTALAIYRQFDGRVMNVFARRLDGSQPGVPQFIGMADIGGADSLRIRFNAAGDTALAIWTQKAGIDSGTSINARDLMAAQYSSGQWSPAVNVTNYPNASGFGTYAEVDSQPDIAFDAEGNAVAVWTDLQLNLSVKSHRTMAARFNKAHSTWSTPEVIFDNTNDAQGDANPRVAAILPNKDIVVAAFWALNKVPVLYRYSATGTPGWTAGNITASNAPSYLLEGVPAGAADSHFDLATNAAGQATLVWQHSYPGASGRQAIFMSRLDPATGRWSPATAVDTTAADAGSNNETGKNSTAPRVVGDDAGNAFIAWLQQNDRGSMVDSVHALRFDAALNAFEGQPKRVQASASGATGAPALSLDAAGNVMLLWRQTQTSGGVASVFASRYDVQATTFGAAMPVERDDESTTDEQAITFAPDGTATAVWTQNKRVMFNRFK
jgi:hypothetical protein